MEEDVLQADGQQGQMDAVQPSTNAVDFIGPAQNQQQPQIAAQEDIYEGFTPSEPKAVVAQENIYEGFTPIKAPMGSMEAVNQAAAEAPLVGRDTFKPKSLLVQQADLYLGRPSAEKFQKLEATGFNPEPAIELSDAEQKLFRDYRIRQGRRTAGNVAGLAAGIGSSFLPGGQSVAGEMIGGFGAALLQQAISPDEFDIQEASSQAIPLLSRSKKAREGAGFLEWLRTTETGVGQQSSRTKQALKEIIAGSGTGALQGFASTLGDESGKTQEVFQQAALGGLLLPAFSSGGRAVSAALRASGKSEGFLGRFAGELQNPYTQQFLQERSDFVRRELGPGGGIDPSMAEQLANTLYSPQRSGSRPEDIRAWQGNITDFLQNSIRTGNAKGLSGDDLTQQVVKALESVTETKNIDQNLVSGIVLNAEQLIGEAKKKASEAFVGKNADLLGAALRSEGELQLNSQYLFDEIRALNEQRKSISLNDPVSIARLDNDIAYKQKQIDDIENGFDPQFGYGESVTQFGVGKTTGSYSNYLLTKFKADQEKGYDLLEPKLKSISVDVPKVDKDGKPVKDDKGNQIIETFTLNDLKEQRTKIFKKIDFDKKVQQADYEDFQELERVEKIMEEGLNTDPVFKDAFKAQSASYREGITRFKGAIISKLMRDVGEGGGSPEVVLNILGERGGEALEVMKKVAGSEWERTFKPVLSDFVYNKLRTIGQKPEELLSLLTEAKMGKGSKLTKEVADEFFPQLSQIQDVANKYRGLVDQQANLISKKNDLVANSEDLLNKINEGQTEAAKLYQENEKRLTGVQSEIEKLRTAKPGIDPKTDEMVKALSELQSAVNGKKIVNLDDEKLKAILSNPDAANLAKDLKVYVQEMAKESTDFQKLVKNSIETGDLYGPATPKNIVDFLTTPKGKLGTGFVADEFMKVIRLNRPDLLGDVQNFIVGKIVEESFKPGKKEINIETMRSLISDKYNPLIQQAFGKEGVQRLNKIADQLSVVVEKESLLNSKILPALTSAAAAAAGVKFPGRVFLSTVVAESARSAVGKALLTREFRDVASRPLDQITKDQMDTFNRRWPKLLTLEGERLMMREEERKDAERPKIPSAAERRF
jgi:hypothetical protein